MIKPAVAAVQSAAATLLMVGGAFFAFDELREVPSQVGGPARPEATAVIASSPAATGLVPVEFSVLRVQKEDRDRAPAEDIRVRQTIDEASSLVLNEDLEYAVGAEALGGALAREAPKEKIPPAGLCGSATC